MTTARELSSASTELIVTRSKLFQVVRVLGADSPIFAMMPLASGRLGVVLLTLHVKSARATATLITSVEVI